MLKGMLILSTAVVVLGAYSVPSTAPQVQPDNPLFGEFNTPFEVPPFDLIREEHFLPAFKEGIEREREEVKAITANSEAPTFANTIEALEYSGAFLTRVDNIFSNLTSAQTNDELQEIAREVTPLLSKHSDDILLDPGLFMRVKSVFDQKDTLNLSPEQERLLDMYYKRFVRGGANLGEAEKARMREINEEISMLTLEFGEHVLEENNKFKMVLDNRADLAGLPDAVISAAAEAAADRGHDGKWVFTIHKPSLIPFLQFSERRDLREIMFKAYISKGANGDELDNRSVLSRIAALRVERANLLGYPTHADYVLDENMAKVPGNVYDLLNQLWVPALAMAQREARDMQAMIDVEGMDFNLEAWDWWYYAEKIKKERYDLDDEQLRPYFMLDNVRNGAFDLAGRLFGITFEEIVDIPKYHEEARAFEVRNADGSHLGVLYTDYFPRTGKRSGAWMNSFRKQMKINGRNVTPVIINCGNFSRPTGDKPTLISLEEALTLFHEFGHALHGLLSDCTYPSLSGTAVPRDFVELPSQIMENWATEPEVMKSYARHYLTGEPIPDELIEKIRNASLFNQGFATVEYLAASFLDMDWHTLTEAVELDADSFENRSMEKIGLIPEIVARYKSPFFNHIFSGGYSSGYYSYIWAEVLDADAFQAFKETSLYDQEVARSYRENILSRGGTEDPMTLYVRFRGAEPSIDALLARKGFK